MFRNLRLDVESKWIDEQKALELKKNADKKANKWIEKETKNR